MKFTFKNTGSYTWAMGNKETEMGSYFEISDILYSDEINIIRHYGMSYIHSKHLCGLPYGYGNYLFVPECAYPLIELMIADIKKLKEENSIKWKSERENAQKEFNDRTLKIKEFVDITKPIEV